MIATWSMQAGLTIRGQHNGQPRRWTITAWAQLPDWTRETVNIRPPVKCTLKEILPLVNQELENFEIETGVASVDAGFQAIAR